jgi:CheY-like chemotaxis protein
VDGLEVLEIKRTKELVYTPVIKLASSREKQDLVRSHEHGVNVFVMKPVSFKESFEAI